MALIHCDFYSNSLGRTTHVYVILPEYRDIKKTPDKIKTLYLLHGLGDNYTKWIRRTSIEKCAAQGDWAVIMPDGGKSFYSNMTTGENYWDYIAKELPLVMEHMFPILSRQKKDRFIAGLSMGGYGSMKMALNYPERFCAAASFSGALHPEKDLVEEPALVKSVWGSLENIRGTESDLLDCILQCKKQDVALPHLYISCGTDDFIYEESQDFCQWLKDFDIPFTYEEWKGTHDWVFWEESMKRALKWFGSKEI